MLLFGFYISRSHKNLCSISDSGRVLSQQTMNTAGERVKLNEFFGAVSESERFVVAVFLH